MLGLPGWIVGGVFAVGMALIVSGLSITSWMISEEKIHFRKMLLTSSFQVSFWIGLVLIGAAVALGSHSIWGALNGLLLLGLSAVQAISKAKQHRS